MTEENIQELKQRCKEITQNIVRREKAMENMRETLKVEREGLSITHLTRALEGEN